MKEVFQVITSKKALRLFLKGNSSGILAFDTETVGVTPSNRPSLKKEALILDRARMVMISFAYIHKGVLYGASVPLRDVYYSPYYLTQDKKLLVSTEDACEIIRPFMEDECLLKVAHNFNYDANVLLNHGVSVKNWYCTMVASYMYDENISVSLKDRCATVGIIIQKYDTVDLSNIEEFAGYAALDAAATLKLYYSYNDKAVCDSLGVHFQPIKECNKEVMEKIEFPVLSTVIDMERRGMYVDVDYFAGIYKEVTSTLDRLRLSICKAAGGDINLNSTQQKQKLLEKLGIKMGEEFSLKSGGFSTSSAALESVEDQHPVIGELIEYSKVSKLATFLSPKKGLPAYADYRGFIHSNIKTVGARTARFSSSNPNLQNIPSRTDTFGIRKGFIAPPGCAMIVADFSGMELVMTANITGEPGMLDVLRKRGGDLHQETADRVSVYVTGSKGNIPRDVGKTLNFGILYGMGRVGLAAQLSGLGFDFIDSSVQQYDMEHRITYVSGRERTIPMMERTSYGDRKRGERQLFNSLIQGGCADFVKDRLVALNSDRLLNKLGCKLIMQVHDEAVFYVPDKLSTILRCKSRIVQIMEDYRFDKGIEAKFFVEANHGYNWKEAK